MRCRLHRTFVLLLGFGALTGCGVHMEPLMPTPVVFTERGLDPLAHIPARERWIPRRVYYATNRKRSDNFLVVQGTNDIRGMTRQAETVVTRLRARGAPV